MITFDYNIKNSISYAQFFESIPYILPCKFCRTSLTDYYKQYPFTSYVNMNPMLDVKKWMYHIHNCVNNKLRIQGLNPTPNPKYSVVKKTYEDWLACDWIEQLRTFWDFLFAVAYNHPRDTKYVPLPNCPKGVYTCKDKCEKNKWNILSVRDRLYWFKRFWAFLPVVLPREIAKKWKELNIHPTLQSRNSTLEWLWKMRCGLDSNFKDPYTSICKKIKLHSVDCNKKRSITCRKTRKK